MLKFISDLIIPSAQACATCSFDDNSSPYFLALIAFMTSIPVFFVGGVVYYLKKHKDKHDENNEKPL